MYGSQKRIRLTKAREKKKKKVKFVQKFVTKSLNFALKNSFFIVTKGYIEGYCQIDFVYVCVFCVKYSTDLYRKRSEAQKKKSEIEEWK